MAEEPYPGNSQQPLAVGAALSFSSVFSGLRHEETGLDPVVWYRV